jgi:hydrogenase maturation protease
MSQVLVAGFGNELRGDDGFGIRVLDVLHPRIAEMTDVELLHVGTGGLRLAQQLLAGYSALVVVDAIHRNEPPGTLYVLEVEDVTEAEMVDLHLATPDKALSVARALGVLPDHVWLVGCEPEGVDELGRELSPAVHAQVEPAARAILRIVAEMPPSEGQP